MAMDKRILPILLASLATVLDRFTRRCIIRHQFARRHGCQPVARSFNKEPFLGLDTLPGTIRALRQHRILEKGCELYRDYGNTFTITELQRQAILTIEPENIKTILSLNFKDYGISFRLAPFKPLLGEGIFDTDGEHWAASRALIRPSFSRDQVVDLTELENLIQDLFVLLPRDGETVVDLLDLFFRYTIDSATEFLFGQSVGTLKKMQSELGTLGPLNIFYRDRKAEECNRICREFVQQFVDEAFNTVEDKKGTEEKRHKRIFSHELAWGTPNKNRVLDELMNVLLAGRDTTTSLLSNLFFMLAKNPAIWDKLRREVASLQGRPPTYEELRSLKYVQCCVNEYGLSPVFEPKGILVGYNVYAMHRRKDIYGADADEFHPERWEDGKLQPRWGYLPFNGGPRICIGQRYALTEVTYLLVRMAQEFAALQSRESGPWVESLTLTLCPRNGTRVCLVPA
ncbi:hypothetical protein BDV12DRAFT_183679 [Aspergillus spectabilis]